MPKLMSLKVNGPNSYNGFGFKFVKGTSRVIEDDEIAAKMNAKGFFDVEDIEPADEPEEALTKDPGSYPVPPPPPPKSGAITTKDVATKKQGPPKRR